MPQKLEEVAAGGLDGIGERLVRTVLGVWDSDLQPSLIAGIRTTMHRIPALTRSVGEFLALEIIGRVLRRDEPAAGGGTGGPAWRRHKFLGW